MKTIKFKNPQYIGDPINAVKIYNEKEVDELIFLDISATVEKRMPNLKIIGEIATECFMPFSYGGGVADIETMKRIFSLGVEKIAINSAAVEHPTFVTLAAQQFGSQSIIIALDVKKTLFGKYEVYTKSGTHGTGKDPVILAKQMEQAGAGEIFLTSINNDGIMEGYDCELINKIAAAVSIPVIACGGAGKLDDIKSAVDAGASAAALGSLAVYQGKNKGVLINFPTRKEIEEVLKEKF